MIEKKPIVADRVRQISGSFAFIEHRFLRNGFWTAISHHERLLYLLLVLVGDRRGLSYYSFDKICSLLAISCDEYIVARNSLIDKDLIAFDGLLFQVLSLPQQPVSPVNRSLQGETDMKSWDPATISRMLERARGENR